MYSDKKILALIPARGGSKGIKKKNIIMLAGEPLISYTIKASLNSRYIDSTVVTTDSLEIAQIAKKYGACVPFIRPAELAADTSKTIDAVLHAIKELKKNNSMQYDALVLLQPTQPLRTSQDIDEAIELFYKMGEKSLVSISSVKDHPLLIRKIDNSGKLIPLLEESSTCRRQDMPAYYRINGCIYINKISTLNHTTSFNDNEIPYKMSEEHSVDIDELSDLHMAEYYLLNKL